MTGGAVKETAGKKNPWLRCCGRLESLYAGKFTALPWIEGES